MTDCFRKTDSEVATIQAQGKSGILSVAPRLTACTTTFLPEKSSPKGIGAQLREFRNHLKLTLRETEERCAQVAQQWGNPAYRISASWLDRVERENRGLSATKLIVLASVYNLTPEQMLSMCPPAGAAFPLSEEQSVPNATLLTEGKLDDSAKLLLPDGLVTDPPPKKTAPLPVETASLPSNYRRAIIGRQDLTLEPMIRAGSIILIDILKR